MKLVHACFLTLHGSNDHVHLKVLFSAEVGAAYSASCLDGSPAGYYIKEHPESTGWVIYLEGG